MLGYLKQSTASQSRMVGPFVDDTDFKTVETGLTIANTDVKLSKNGAAGVNKNSGGGTHRNNGMYSLTFDATDTGTVGELEGSILVSGALVVVFKFVVLEEVVYDALFAASAPGYLQPTTAGRTLDVTAGGTAGIDWANIEAPTTANNLSGTNIDTDQVIASVSGNVDGSVASVTGAVGSVTGAVGSVTGNVGGNVTGSVGSVVAIDTTAGAIDSVTLVATTTTNTDMRGTDSALLAANINLTAGTLDRVTLADTTTANTDMRGTDSALLAASAPTNFSSQVISGAGAVDSLIQGFINTTLTESSVARINDNFEFFYDNSDAQTTQVVDDVGGGGGGGTDWTSGEREEIRGRLGITGTTAAGGNTPTLSLQTSVDGIPTTAEFEARTLVAANYFNPTTDAVANVTLVATLTTYTGDTPQTADHTSAIADIPTVSEFNARTIPSADYFDPAADAVANVTLVATTTTNTDMRGTNSALLAADINLTAGAVDNVTLVATTTTNTDMRGTDSAATATALATAQLDLDTITGSDGATLATSQPNEDFGAVRKNATFSNFTFLMVLTSDHVTPATGLTVTGERSLDAGAFAGVSGTITEISNGIYQFDALAADTNGDTLNWRFSSGTADDAFVTIKTVA